MKKIILALGLLFASNSYSAINLDEYALRPSQIESFRKLEGTGKYSEEFLLKFIQAMHNQNLADERAQNIYIPPYTEEELLATIEWARGAAFSAFAEYAGFQFLGEAYRADCPNVALFRFARASGTRFVKVDIARETTNQFHLLQSYFSRDRESFPEKFIEEAKKFGFDIYLVKTD